MNARSRWTRIWWLGLICLLAGLAASQAQPIVLRADWLSQQWDEAYAKSARSEEERAIEQALEKEPKQAELFRLRAQLLVRQGKLRYLGHGMYELNK